MILKWIFQLSKKEINDILIIQENRYQIGFYPFGSGSSIQMIVLLTLNRITTHPRLSESITSP
ncbi:hypothetical protein PORCRE_760 [Porphyromonas crevioricanis JCM 15906]|uniref:Uncharacterized protein n=2 Tax=Porphyromonas crevioricanis TaxID=393921 RepID=A0A2X4PZH6_9PORP|nr:hypothetical protein PORCRE_760 [Porphyromonas crevioricanis JCM 15906]GAD08129.1 hypothetical protein PORCAN_1764 [Porphyromonas crevioricanis JCM 13913]SJZ97340.1 hypothetical protein SAMN02745203_01456 [Porphyromonas crevioricanis]SQH73719.1 Uncharacterised protein [Porphyromonas crevioricanis]